MELHTIGIDLGKTVFYLVGLNQRGEVVGRKKFSRSLATAALYSELKSQADWHGSLRRSIFFRPGIARSKRGNSYLRRLFVQCARAAMRFQAK